MLLSPLSWPILLDDAKKECRHVLTDLSCLPPQNLLAPSLSCAVEGFARDQHYINKGNNGKRKKIFLHANLNISNKRDNCQRVSLRMAWDHSHFPSRQNHLYQVQGELLTGPFFHHTNRTHLLLENKTHPIRRVRNSHYITMLQIRSRHFQRSGNTIL